MPHTFLVRLWYEMHNEDRAREIENEAQLNAYTPIRCVSFSGHFHAFKNQMIWNEKHSTTPIVVDHFPNET